MEATRLDIAMTNHLCGYVKRGRAKAIARLSSLRSMLVSLTQRSRAKAISSLLNFRLELVRSMRKFLYRYFRRNPILADAGEILLDEHRIIQLRRRILEHCAAFYPTEGQRNDNAPLNKIPDSLVLPSTLECCLPEHDEVGINRSILSEAAARFARSQSKEGERLAKKSRLVASESGLSKYYKQAHETGDLSALCLSGGGIRSAAFALGVVQGLTKRDLLQRFDYLSTVSGGGYLGSFLTAWVQRRGYQEVCDELRGRVTDGSPLQYLRSYTSYLTPDRGPFTADMLSVVAIYVRNLVLNWLIILPFLVMLLAALKMFAALIWSLPADQLLASPFVLVAIYAAGIATMESLRQRPGWESTGDGNEQFHRYVKWALFASALAASIVALKFLQVGNTLNADDAANRCAVVCEVLHPELDPLTTLSFPTLILGAINFISWMIAYFISRSPTAQEISTRTTVRDQGFAAFGNLLSFTFSGMMAGCFLGLMFYGASKFWHFDLTAFTLLCFGPPAVAAAVFLGETIHVGLTSTTQWSDGEREWLATAAGYHGRVAVVWMLLVLFVFGGSLFVFRLHGTEDNLSFHRLFAFGTTGGIAGATVAWLGRASATAATLRERYNTWKNLSASVLLAIATPVFVIVTISSLSAALDYIVAGQPLSFSVVNQWATIFPAWDTFPLEPTKLPGGLFGRLGIVIAIAATIFGFASWAINTNRFSLHGLYRNRLIRAFLGGSRVASERQPNPLSMFDENDNISLCDLWPNRYGPPPGPAKLVAPLPAGALPPQFMVINCALNVLRSDNLAWQERKALSLTFTSRAVGSAALDGGAGCYRRSREYGSLHKGVSLGTAMTISGAAVSPNMGYHSSPALSVLMTLFNVRLGAWLGNPGPDGARVIGLEGPRFSALPLIQEAMGLATEDKSYVYLSDGGHFENLGIYEMVRRRCRFIVVSDAGCDINMAFEDLGNAVRKISIDLNVSVEFDLLQIPPRKTPAVPGGYVAVAKITYPEADSLPGYMLYIKPSYRGTEPASVRAYAEANPAFPHEPTTDQMFGESQFEAYRALGEYVIQTIDGQPGRKYGKIDTFVEAVRCRLAHHASVEAHPKVGS